MKDTLKIGLTGGIASGKSTVCDLFSQLSVEIIDADKISHDITKKDGLAFQEILDYFGKKILGLDGELDRQQLRSIIFNDATAKRVLENKDFREKKEKEIQFDQDKEKNLTKEQKNALNKISQIPEEEYLIPISSAQQNIILKI